MNDSAVALSSLAAIANPNNYDFECVECGTIHTTSGCPVCDRDQIPYNTLQDAVLLCDNIHSLRHALSLG